MKLTLKNYTLVEIADRFEEAAYTLRRLPSVRMKGYPKSPRKLKPGGFAPKKATHLTRRPYTA